MPIKKEFKTNEEMLEALKKPVIADKVVVSNGKFDVRELSEKDFRQYVYESWEFMLDTLSAYTNILANIDINLQVLLKHYGVDKYKHIKELSAEADKMKKAFEVQKRKELNKKA